MNVSDPTPQPSRGGGEAATWQPIDTAPKDGTVIMLWLPDTKYGFAFGYWGEQFNEWLDDEDECALKEPTYWQPLPPPPGSSALPSAPRGDGDAARELLPELNEEERAAMNAIPADFVDRVLAGERPIKSPCAGCGGRGGWYDGDEGQWVTCMVCLAQARRIVRAVGDEGGEQ